MLLQATRHLGFNALSLQYSNIAATIPLLLALSLPIDGTDWAAQLDCWGTLDWVVLMLLSTVVFIGSGLALQVGHRARYPECQPLHCLQL